MINKLKQHTDSLFLIIGNAVSRILMIVSTIIMVKLLGDTVYSKYAVLYNGLLGVQVFLTLGLNAVLIKRIAAGEDILFTVTKIVKIIFLVSLIFFLLFFTLIKNNWVYSLSYFKEIGFFSIIFSAISIVFFSILVSVLYGKEEKNKIAKLNIFNSVLILFFLVYFSIKQDLNLIFIGLGLANSISIILFVLFHKNIFINKIELKNNYIIEDGKKGGLIDYIKQGFPIFLSALLVTPIVGVIYTLMHSNELGEKIAIFSVAMQWYSIILFIPGVLANLLLAEFSRNENILTLAYYCKRIFLNFTITVVVSIFVYILLLFVLPIYGAEYKSNISVFCVFILVALVNSFNTVAGQFFISVNKQIFGFYFNIVWAVLLLTLVFLALNNGYGILGVSLSFLISYIFHAFNQNLYIYYFLKSSKNV